MADAILWILAVVGAGAVLGVVSRGLWQLKRRIWGDGRWTREWDAEKGRWVDVWWI